VCGEDCTALDVNLGIDVGRLTLDEFDVELGRCRKLIYFHVHGVVKDTFMLDDALAGKQGAPPYRYDALNSIRLGHKESGSPMT
jgi:hypothetical protein